MHSRLVKSSLILAVFLTASSAIFGCTAPKTLADKAQLHPDGDVYAEIGNWFGDHKQYECAIESYQKGLQLEPGSAKLYYLVGLTLFASGHPDLAAQPHAKSIYLLPDVLKPH